VGESLPGVAAGPDPATIFRTGRTISRFKSNAMARQINHAVDGWNSMKKSKPQTDTSPKIGDRVRLVPEAPLRNDEMDLQGKTGEIIECTEGKRVTVRFANGRLLMGRDVALFERT
jgi:hypothetical protein